MKSVSFGLASTQGLRVVDHAQHRRAGVDEAAELDVVDLRRVAGERRAHRRVIEIALRLIERRLGLQVRREFFERQIGIAEQLVADAGLLLAAAVRPASARRRAARSTCRGRTASRCGWPSASSCARRRCRFRSALCLRKLDHAAYRTPCRWSAGWRDRCGAWRRVASAC